MEKKQEATEYQVLKNGSPLLARRGLGLCSCLASAVFRKT